MIRRQVMRGKLLAVVDGPDMILEVKGEEVQFPLSVEVSLDWITRNMEKMVTVMVEDGKIAQIG